MKYRTTAALLVVGTVIFTLLMYSALYSSKKGKYFYSQSALYIPDTALSRIDDSGYVNLVSKYKGKRWLLHVMSTWCPLCIDEIPVLYQAKNNIQLPIVLLAYKENNFDKLNNMLKKYPGIFVENLMDNDGLFVVDLGSSGVPRTLLINQYGQVEKVWDKRFTKENINEIIEMTDAIS